MFGLNKKPPYRPTVKSDGDVVKQRQSKGQEFHLNPAFSVFFGFSTFVILVRLLIPPQPIAQVGDMMIVSTENSSVSAAITAIPARVIQGPWANPGRLCTLDISMMAKQGGALTVSAVRSDGVMLLWAGRATASGSADCGKDAQILVTDGEYGRLLKSQMPKSQPYSRG